MSTFNFQRFWALVIGSVMVLTILGAPADARAETSQARPAAGQARPASGDPFDATTTTYKLVSRSKVKNYVDRRKRLGICSVSQTMTCRIDKGESATRTFGAAFGVSNRWIANELNISHAKSVSLTVGCLVKVKKGYQLVAYALGSRHKYKVRRTTTSFAGKFVKTSGWKYTFNPYRNSIHCQIVKA